MVFVHIRRKVLLPSVSTGVCEVLMPSRRQDLRHPPRMMAVAIRRCMKVCCRESRLKRAEVESKHTWRVRTNNHKLLYWHDSKHTHDCTGNNANFLQAPELKQGLENKSSDSREQATADQPMHAARHHMLCGLDSKWLTAPPGGTTQSFKKSCWVLEASMIRKR
eukprot:6305950-Amphidinium_carterae.3